jgi:hypothetical protein
MPALVERVFAGVCANDYGQFDGLIGLMAAALGADGLAMLKTRFEGAAAASSAPKQGTDRKVIAMSTRGPIHQDDLDARYNARRFQSALTDIADALGDVDGYAARFSAEERANPSIAADIAQRLLAAHRAQDAMTALAFAKADALGGRLWPNWQRVRIDVLDALGQAAEAQIERWSIFERNLDAEYLRAHLKRLPDFDDEEAEERALGQVRQHVDFHRALGFLIDWPAHGRAAELVLARHTELDGDHYWLLTPAAEALVHSAPLAATLMLRSMIDFSLDRAKYKRYGHAARHLLTCSYLARQVQDFGGTPITTPMLLGLRLATHARPGSGTHRAGMAPDARVSCPQPRIIKPFADLACRDPAAVRMGRIDQDVAFLLDNRRRYDQQGRGAAGDPLRTAGNADAAGGLRFPANRQAFDCCDLGSVPQVVGNIDRHQIAIERQAACVQMDEGFKARQSPALRGIDHRHARLVPSPASQLGAGSAQIVRFIISRIRCNAPDRPAHA